MYKMSFGVIMALLIAFGGIASAQPSGSAIGDSSDNNNYIAPEEDADSTEHYSRFDDGFDTNNFREPPEDEGTIHPETRGYYEAQVSRESSARLDDPASNKNAASADEVKTN